MCTFKRFVVSTFALLVACGGGGGDGDDIDAPVGSDTRPPIFAGLQIARLLDENTVELQWMAAQDPSQPISYQIYVSETSGGQDFTSAHAVVVGVTTTTLSNLTLTPGTSLYFVVRAADSVGNQDSNTFERELQVAGPTVRLLGQYNNGQSWADIAVDEARGVAYISGWFSETLHIVDVSNRAEPVALSVLTDLGYGADVQYKGTTLYAAHEFAGRGADIYDVSDPANPVLVHQMSSGTGYPIHLNDCHNLWPQPDRELLYCASTTTGALAILSTGEGGVGAREIPAYLGRINKPADSIGIHDAYAEGDRLYAAFLDAGIYIYDISDPASPVLLASHLPSDPFIHNLWPSTDGNYLFSTDEYEGGHMRVWDISDLGNIHQVGSYQAHPDAIIHNVEVVGDYAYISYYAEGLRIVSVADPTNPQEVGAYDTFVGANDALAGAWGVDPHPPYVYVSNTDSGMSIFEFTPPQ